MPCVHIRNNANAVWVYFADARFMNSTATTGCVPPDQLPLVSKNRFVHCFHPSHMQCVAYLHFYIDNIVSFDRFIGLGLLIDSLEDLQVGDVLKSVTGWVCACDSDP